MSWVRYAVLLLIFLLVFSVPLEHTEMPDTHKETRALVPHDPIKIESDTDLEKMAADEGWAGSGTEDDPYIIEGYAIQTEDATTPVEIKNTEKYFVLRNCEISKTEGSSAHTGVNLYNVSNATIYNITVHTEGDAHFSEGIVASYIKNTMISGSTIMDSTVGILAESGDITIVNNDIEVLGHITPTGVYLYHMNSAYVVNNRIVSIYFGVYVESSYSSIEGNEISIVNPSNPTFYFPSGMFVWGSSTYSTYIRNNTIHGGDVGIYAARLLDIYIVMNEIYNNTKGVWVVEKLDVGRFYLVGNRIHSASEGLTIESAQRDSRFYISENSIWDFEKFAMNLSVEESLISIEDNTMEDGGIFLDPDGNYTNTTITPSNLVNGRSVVFLKNADMGGRYAPRNAGQIILYKVRNYTIEANIAYGIEIISSSGIAIENSTIGGVLYGIDIFSSSGITVKNNVIRGENYGVYFYYSNGNLITKNSVNATYTCFIKRSSGNYIYGNEFYGDGYDEYTSNYWYNDADDSWILGAGNYWYEWAKTHEDSDGDGIIDESYPLQGGDNADPAPLAKSPLISSPGKAELVAESGDGYVHLTWSIPDDGGSEITEYRIYRGEDVNSLSLYTTTTENEYNDTSVENGVRYYYYVTAVNSAGEGEKSNIVESTPLGLPGAPLSFAYTLDGNRITLTWTPPSDNGGSEIREYRVYRNEEVIFRAAPGQTSYSETLEYGVQYSYYITAVNSAGEGERSATISVRVVSVPDAPMDLLASLDNGTLRLSWRAPADNGEPIMEYRVYRNDTLVATTDNETTEIMFTSDVSGSYYVTAVNSLGESEASNMVSVSYEVEILPIEFPGEEPEDNETEVPVNETSENQNPDNETPVQTPVEVIVQSQGNGWMAAVALEVGILGLVAYQIISTRGNKGKSGKEEISGEEKEEEPEE